MTYHDSDSPERHPDKPDAKTMQNERTDVEQPCPHCGQDLRLPPDTFERWERAEQAAARAEARAEALVEEAQRAAGEVKHE